MKETADDNISRHSNHFYRYERSMYLK